MKPGKIIALSLGLVFIVSAAWAWNHNGNGTGHYGKGMHKNYENVNGQQGERFVDKNNDGICDNYATGNHNSGKRFYNSYAAKGRMMKNSHCPGWQPGEDKNNAPESGKTTGGTTVTE